MRRCRISKDYADYRGRWKKRRVIDQYEDVLLLYPDAKSASALCPGGPMKYTIKPLLFMHENVYADLFTCMFSEKPIAIHYANRNVRIFNK